MEFAGVKTEIRSAGWNLIRAIWSRILWGMFLGCIYVGDGAQAQSSPAIGTSAADPYAEDRPAYNDWQARTFLIEVQPLVEKFTGWPMAELPAFKLVSREQYAEKMTDEFVNEVRRSDASISEIQARNLMPLDFASHARGLLGRYSSLSNTIYLLPGNLTPIFRSIEPFYTRDLVEIIIAHEITHTFQNHEYPAREYQRLTPEERQTFGVMKEGHAMFVQEHVAADLHLNDAARRIVEEMQSQESRTPGTWTRYLEGRKFVETIYLRYGARGVNQLFLTPPKSRDAIANPEFYLIQNAAAFAKLRH